MFEISIIKVIIYNILFIASRTLRLVLFVLVVRIVFKEPVLLKFIKPRIRKVLKFHLNSYIRQQAKLSLSVVSFLYLVPKSSNLFILSLLAVFEVIWDC